MEAMKGANGAPSLGWTFLNCCLASSALYAALLAFMDEICPWYNT